MTSSGLGGGREKEVRRQQKKHEYKAPDRKAPEVFGRKRGWSVGMVWELGIWPEELFGPNCEQSWVNCIL